MKIAKKTYKKVRKRYRFLTDEEKKKKILQKQIDKYLNKDEQTKRIRKNVAYHNKSLQYKEIDKKIVIC